MSSPNVVVQWPRPLTSLTFDLPGRPRSVSVTKAFSLKKGGRGFKNVGSSHNFFSLLLVIIDVYILVKSTFSYLVRRGLQLWDVISQEKNLDCPLVSVGIHKFLCFSFMVGFPFLLRVLLISGSGGIIFFIALMYARRWTLRLLLSYRGWMCEYYKCFSKCNIRVAKCMKLDVWLTFCRF